MIYSTSWSGEISTLDQGNWRILNALIAQNELDHSLWIDSGDIPIDFGSKFRMAFRYNGSGKSTRDGTYEIDDIRIFSKQ